MFYLLLKFNKVLENTYIQTRIVSVTEYALLKAMTLTASSQFRITTTVIYLELQNTKAKYFSFFCFIYIMYGFWLQIASYPCEPHELGGVYFFLS